MFRNILTAGVLMTSASFGANAATQIALFEDFEDSTVTYTTSIPEFSDGVGDHFTRVSPATSLGTFINYNGIQGNGYFTAWDIDGEGAAATQTLTFSNIDISGLTNLTFAGLFAEDDDGANNDWDTTDFFLAEFQIDNGGFQNLLAFENDGIGSGTGFNGAPFQDTDFDGTGDGTELTDTFSAFNAAIAGTGTTLDIRFTISLNAGDEDIAFDNITVLGESTAPVPVPAAVWLFGSALMGLVGIRRRA